MELLALAGSLRRASYNRGLVRAAGELAPPGVTVATFDLRPVPFYDGDLEAAGVPASVLELKAAIAAADGVLLCTPENNAGVPAVLKNAIDWASRSPGAIQGKPVALCGATPGRFGTVRAQLAWRPTLANLACPVLPAPSLAIAGAADHFDADGNLTDTATRAELAALLAAFAAWIEKVGESSGTTGSLRTL